jgi:hypothetical protein
MINLIIIILIIILAYLISNYNIKSSKVKKKKIILDSNKKIKIIIVGAGWAGISVAYVLSHFDKFDIILIEKEDRLGGQATSKMMKDCDVELCWRVYFDLYFCIQKILKDANLTDKLCPINETIITDNKKSLAVGTIFDNKNMFDVLRYYDVDYFTCFKFFYLLSLPRVILEKFYGDTSFMEYLNNYNIFKLICGPVLGSDPKKISIPPMINLLKNRLSKNTYGFKNYKVTCGPPDVELFNYLETFLKNRGVNILLNTECTELIEKNNKIHGINISGNKYLECDEIIISCSLYSVISLIKKFNDEKLNKQLNELTKCLQNYLSMNLYFSEQLGQNNNYILLNQPWIPIIEVKRNKLWYDYIINNCNAKIKDVWNVAVVDFYKGYNAKILRDCSIDEVINETINQIEKDIYISKLTSKTGKTFRELLIGVEIHDYWQDKNNKIYTKNPKFSINTNAANNLLDYNYNTIPHNIWFAGYYCKAGLQFSVNMENSAYIGFNCAKLICDKYKLTLPLDINEILNKYKKY